MLKKKRSLSNDLIVKQRGEVLKVGYLKKKGHVRRNWLDRWFVLTSEGIYYYKTKEVSDLLDAYKGEMIPLRAFRGLTYARCQFSTPPSTCGLD